VVRVSIYQDLGKTTYSINLLILQDKTPTYCGVKKFDYSTKLEIVCTPKGYRGFKSLLLRQKKEHHPNGWRSFFWHRIERNLKNQCSCPVDSCLFPARREQLLTFCEAERQQIPPAPSSWPNTHIDIFMKNRIRRTQILFLIISS